MYTSLMPRQSRIDAPGALHHIIGRGIAKEKIFYDDHDREKFLERFGAIVAESGTGCLAWALIPNHFHLLLKTGHIPLSEVMRRLLTGYAGNFNRRHGRWGHLFQNRYKSILCQEETYLLELIRYIHLNPLRAGVVDSLEALDHYPYTGHSTLMGIRYNEWQKTDKILERFGHRRSDARRRYRRFVQKGIEQGRRPEITGGGLVRSVGGWAALKARRMDKDYVKGDERILGDNDFVLNALKEANERLARKYLIRAKGFDLDQIAERVATALGVPLEQVFAAGKDRRTVQARSLLCYWAVRECGMTMVSLARRLKISSAAVSQSVRRGESVAAENNLILMPQ